MNFFISKINPAGDGYLIYDCLYILTHLNLLSIGWSKIALQPDKNNTKDNISKLLKQYYKNSDFKLQNEPTSLYNFICEMKFGDMAITPTGYADDDEIYFSKILNDRAINAQMVNQNKKLNVFADEFSYLRKIEIVKNLKLKELPKNLNEYIKNISALNTCAKITNKEIQMEIIEIL